MRIQILTALISYLLLAIYKKAHGFTDSLWNYLVSCAQRCSSVLRLKLSAIENDESGTKYLPLFNPDCSHEYLSRTTVRLDGNNQLQRNMQKNYTCGCRFNLRSKINKSVRAPFFAKHRSVR